MGQIIGIIGVKEPPYSVVWQSPPYEIRLYPKIFIAETSCPINNEQGNPAFMNLAKYIGVFGQPNNNKQVALAMTAPVITGPTEKIAMTAPVLTNSGYMQFVLPEEYRDFESIPKPTNPAVTIRAIPQRLIAVNTFSGSYSKDYFMSKLEELHKKLLDEELMLRNEPVTSEASIADFSWSFAQYNPPFTLPFLRRNEAWIEISDSVKTQALRDILSEKSN